MKEREFLNSISSLPVITTKQVTALLGEKAYSKVFLNRLMQRGSIRRVERGIYTIHDDPMIYATHMFYPSYISLLSAFQYHGTTTQLPINITVMTTRNHHIDNIEFIRIKEIWGYQKVVYLDFQIFMAELEKAIIDAILTEMTPLDEIQSALEECDLNKLTDFTMRMNTSSRKKIGYVADISGFFLERVHDSIKNDRNYVYYSTGERGNRWRVSNDRS